VAYADFNGITGLVRACLTSDGGPSPRASADGTACTGWPDSTGTSDATLAGTAPEINTNPTGGLQGPCALHVAENGFGFAGVVNGLTNWTIATCLRADSLSSFRNIFSSQGGSGEGSLYANAGALTYEEGSTETLGFTLSTGTVYTIIFTADASNYRCYVDGTLVWTSTMTPADQPAALETAAYGGSGAVWSGDWWAIAIYATTVSGGDIATLHAALLEEANGAAAEQDIDLTTIASGHTVHDLASVTSGSEQTINLTTIASGHTLPALASVAAQPEQDIDLAAIPSGHVVRDLASVTLVGALHDAFEGSGTLDGYTTVNASDLPNVTEANGRYLAELADNTADVTTWFNSDAGRGDFKATEFPFEIIVRNIGIGVSAADTQGTPTLLGNPYNFCGMQVNADLGSPEQDYRHFVVGYRGATGFGGSERTIEAKTNASGSSSVNDVGTNAITGTRADFRIVGSAGKAITFQWQEPNQLGPGGQPDPAQDSWSSAHAFPGSEPAWPDTVYVGLVTYAFGTDGVPFVGTADAIEDILSAQNVDLGAVASGHQVHDLESVTIKGSDQDIDLTTIASGHVVHDLASVVSGPANDVDLGALGPTVTVHALTSVGSGPALEVDLGALPSGTVVHDLASVDVVSGQTISLTTIVSGHQIHELASVAAQAAQDVDLTAIASGRTVHDLASLTMDPDLDVDLTAIPSGRVVHDLDSVATVQSITLQGRASTLTVHDLASLTVQAELDVDLATIASGHVVHDLASVVILQLAASTTITAYSRPATLIDIEEDPVPHTAGDRVETTIRFRVGGVLTAPDSWSIHVKPRRGAAFEVPSGDASISEVQPGEYVWSQQTSHDDATHVGRWDYTVDSDGSVAPGARNGFFEVRRAAVVA